MKIYLFTGFMVNIFSSVKIYLLFTFFVVDDLELCQNLPVFHRFCGECFGALSKSNYCSQILW